MRQVVLCSYLLVGVSWLFPPVLLITVPIAVAVTVLAWVATTTTRVVQAGQAAADQPPPPPPVQKQPGTPEYDPYGM